MARAQIEIGQRAFEEVKRLFKKDVDAKNALGITGNQHLYEWMNGVAPSTKYLKRLHYCGADIIYILTGVRK